MIGDQDRGFDLHNETRINVATLLQELVGSIRSYEFRLDTLPLAEDATARDVLGHARLTRLRSEILVTAAARGTVELECARCLRNYQQPFDTKFSEQFRQIVDVRSGNDIDAAEWTTEVEADEAVYFDINEAHELDLGEALRQWIVLALPMRPDCGEVCAGPDTTEAGDAIAADDRFAALAQFLDDERDQRTDDQVGA